jgi:branched-chain amino acid transport system permease protein
MAAELVLFLRQVIGGLSIGGIYALLALGYSLILGVYRIVNLAQGDTYMLGAYLGLAAASVALALGPILGPFAVITLALLGTAVVGVLSERLIFNPVQKSRPVNMLVATIGTSIFLRNAAMLVWGSDARLFPKLYNLRPLIIGNVAVPGDYICIIVVVLASVSMLSLMLQRSRLGKAIRAVAQDKDAAALMGINISLINSTVFGISAMLGALGGILIGPVILLSPHMGALVGLKGFSAAVVGGLGYLPGSVVGGFTIGVLENIAAAYISSQYRHAIAFLVLIVFLLFRPGGIFGKSRVVKL